MPVRMYTEDTTATVEPTRVFWRRDPDTKTPIYFKLRPVPPDVHRRTRNRLNRGITAQKAQRDDMARIYSRNEEMTRTISVHGLVDSEGFSVVAMGASAATRMSELLGTTVNVREEVKLDGRWTDEIKVLVFELLPTLSSWLYNRIDEITDLEAEEEEVLGKT